MNALLLIDLLRDLRAAILDAYDTFDNAPTKPNVTIGHGLAPPHDCRNRCWLTYEVIQRMGITSDRCAVVPQVKLRIEIAREWPGEASAKKEEEAVEIINADAATLWYGLTAKNFAEGDTNKLFPSFPGLGCEAVRFEDMRPREPLGNAAGWVWRITVDLMGRPV